ncbi:Protein transport Sec16B [Gossypium australe]|uniref:Protein transport Sec16B n=1 Tax=Gossypium australe TaxID=47621 RepID=A0A5B6X1V7_9ROSI|nr:Protein transport Sec16B [Gossypium australe]
MLPSSRFRVASRFLMLPTQGDHLLAVLHMHLLVLDSVGASISVLNMLEVFNSNTSVSVVAPATCDYFNILCQQSFLGSLVGGNASNKDLIKWIDDRIASCESPNMDYGKGENMRMLLSFLKIACQHYGKLRSPFGSDTLLKETDTPESAVSKLFASTKRKDASYGALNHCLQLLPSEGHVRGPALVLSSQLGEQFYIDTIKQMTLHQLVAGSPLRTLWLLIAGQPTDFFPQAPQLMAWICLNSMQSPESDHQAAPISTPEKASDDGYMKRLRWWLTMTVAEAVDDGRPWGTSMLTWQGAARERT